MGNEKVGTCTNDDDSNKICMQDTTETNPEEHEAEAKLDDATGVDLSPTEPAKDDPKSSGSVSEADLKETTSAVSTETTSIETLVPANFEEPPVTVPQGDEAVKGQESSQQQPVNEEDAQSDDEEEDEGPWELKTIMTVEELTNSCPIKCFTEDCPLPAGVLYTSVSSKKFKYYYCLDCQESDFEGWPPIEELPVKTLSKEHQKLLVTKCSKYKDTAMPEFFESPVKATKPSKSTNTVTPPPNSLSSPAPQPKDKDGVPVITPADGGKKKPKPSKAHLEMHRKWQEAAESLGGADARIVLSKPTAKKIIFDFLYDDFRPCTISQIYEGLKATIPSPVLKACLDDMTLDKDTEGQFAESDDEEEGKPKAKTAKPKGNTANPEDTQYKASLCLKAGRGSGSTLYFVDYNKAKNGDGFPHEEKSKLAGELSVAEAEKETLQHAINSMKNETESLLKQPKNPELAMRLTKEEEELSALKDALEEARNLVVNEAHKNQVKRRLDNYSNIWRKRRNLCMTFLSSMEDWTEGTVTAKKCFAENGSPMELESDESAAASAMEYAKNKKKAVTKRPRSSEAAGCIEPNANFVAIMMNKQGKRTRVFVDDDIHASTD